MNRFFVLIIAGLCLALIALGTGCDRSSTMPKIDPGIVTITDDGDGVLFCNEPVVVAWKGIPWATTYKVAYSSDDGINWVPIGGTKEGQLQLKWNISSGITSIEIRVESYGIGDAVSPPISTAFSEDLSIALFGNPTQIGLETTPQNITPMGMFDLTMTMEDKWENEVTDINGVYDSTTDFGDGMPMTAPLIWENGTAIVPYVYYFPGEYHIYCLVTIGTTDITGYLDITITLCPTISVPPLNIEEGTTGTIIFLLSKPATGVITAEYTTIDVTATAWHDYTPILGVVTFPPGVTKVTKTVSTTEDDTAEINETFLIKLTNPVGATIDASSTTITIIDSD